MRRHSRPPRMAVFALKLFIRHEAVREDVLADLARGFGSRKVDSGTLRARAWYWRQTIGVVAHRGWARAFDADVASVRRTRRWQSDRSTTGGGEVVESTWKDIRYALRGFKRSPGFTIVAVLTIALGVGANASIFSIVNGVLLTPLPYVDADRMVMVWPEKRFSGQMLEQVGERTTSFAGMSLFRQVPYTLLDEGVSQEVTGVRISANHFEVMGVTPALGRAFLPEESIAEGGGVAVISHGLWQRRFGGDPNIVGRRTRISGMGREARTIVGVLPRGYRPVSGDQAEVWTPVDMSPDSLEYAGQFGFSVVARLQGATAVEAASAEVRSLVPDLSAEYPTQFREVRRSPVDVVPFSEVLVRDVRPLLLTLLASVGLVLLIACTNVANLLLARTLQRQEEISLRLALGAERGRIIRQVLTESAVLGLLGGAAGVGLAYGIMPFLEAHIVSGLPRPATDLLDVRVLGFAMAASLLAGLLFGLAPALRAVRMRGVGALTQATRGALGGRRQNLVNGALVTSEVALSVLLVVGASLVLKSFWKLTQEDVGFPTEGLLAVEVALPEGRYGTEADLERYFTSAIERLTGAPGVRHVAAVNYVPLTPGNAGFPYTVEGQPLPEGTASLVFNVRVATTDYFNAMGIRLLEGRMLDSSDRGEGDWLPTVVNEAFKRRHWPGESALGKRILTAPGDPLAEVVGIVSDVKHQSLGQDAHPTAYFTPWPISWSLDYLVVRADGSPEALRTNVSAILREMDPEVVLVSVRTMDEVVAASLGSVRSVTSLFSAFAGLALLLGVVGVYGVTSYGVSRRLREMGVRFALGASSGSVLWGTIRSAMIPVLVGIVAGVALSLASSRVLVSMLFQVDPTDPTVLASVAGVLALAGVAASFLPARRAARTDPVTVLKGN